MHSHSHSSPQQNEPKNCGSDMCLVENRDIENFGRQEQETIAARVWETCKPGSKFTGKTPTVSARRVQLMRVQLQSDSKESECEVLRDNAVTDGNKIPYTSNARACDPPRSDALAKMKSFLAASTCANKDEDNESDDEEC